eukprot:4228054-Prymnesium_polylepis.1
MAGAAGKKHASLYVRCPAAARGPAAQSGPAHTHTRPCARYSSLQVHTVLRERVGKLRGSRERCR